VKEPGLDKRHRDQDGTIHRKEGNTLVGTLRKTYGEDFLSDWRADAKLETVLGDTGAESLTELVKKHRNTK
jgi:hypothetical protein